VLPAVRRARRQSLAILAVLLVAYALLLALCSSCSFVERANEFKGRLRIDLFFPLNLIPGMSELLPHAVLDIGGGFEWHNDAERHRYEMEKMRLRAQMTVEELRAYDVFLAELRRGEVQK
jgi:hypothetical protein